MIIYIYTTIKKKKKKVMISQFKLDVCINVLLFRLLSFGCL